MKFLITTLALCLCTVLSAQDETEAKSYDSADLDAFEATFRHLFDKNASGRQRNVSYFFLRIENEDPPQLFLARFEDEIPKVLPASKSRYERGRGILHEDSDELGLVFRIDGFKKVNEKKYEIEGGYYEAGLSSSGNSYVVELIDGTWVVTSDVMNWISRKELDNKSLHTIPASLRDTSIV